MLFKRVCVHVYMLTHHTHTYMCIGSLWKDIRDTGNIIAAGDEN